MVQVPSLLQIHPEVWRHFEKLSQTQRGTGRNAAPTINDFIDTLIGNGDRLSQVTLPTISA